MILSRPALRGRVALAELRHGQAVAGGVEQGGDPARRGKRLNASGTGSPGHQGRFPVKRSD